VSSDEPLFLDVEDILEIHEAQLEIYGGSAGLRDRGLLESAVAQP
jgi:death-on-curing protein